MPVPLSCAPTTPSRKQRILNHDQSFIKTVANLDSQSLGCITFVPRIFNFNILVAPITLAVVPYGAISTIRVISVLLPSSSHVRRVVSI